MKNFLDGGEGIVEALRNIGVDYIFSSPGSEWAPLWEAMVRQNVEDLDGPTYIDIWHETLAVNMAVGYTLMTGRPQAVTLHAGVGLLQGSMGVQGAYINEIPMVVMSGESLGYGEDPLIDPGAQWQRNLSVVGGPDRLVAPFVKWSSPATSVHTLYETVFRAAEMAQRVPKGPTYLNVGIETMSAEWHPPKSPYSMPEVPLNHPAPDDVARIASLIAAAENPVIVTEGAGRDQRGFDGLRELVDLMAIPVVDGSGQLTCNLPQDHPMYMGDSLVPFRETTDLLLLVKARAPWHPASDRPPNATIVVLDENPHKPHMVYQAAGAQHSLEADVGTCLSHLATALRYDGVDDEKVAARRERIEAEHEKMVVARSAMIEECKAKDDVDPRWLCAAVGEVFGDDAIIVDETTTHGGLVKQLVGHTKYQSYVNVTGGLGQGIGVALGVKMAARERSVVLMIGDGTFLYNPSVQGLGAARDNDLPILIIIYNNGAYAAMKGGYTRGYPDGIAITNDTFHGVNIDPIDYEKLVEPFGFHGERVEKGADVVPALERAKLAMDSGTPVILNAVLSPTYDPRAPAKQVN